MEQPEIAEAAVVGEADRVRGEIPVAYIVTARRAATRHPSKRAAGRSWRLSKSRGGSRRWKSCRETRWEKCRNILMK